MDTQIRKLMRQNAKAHDELASVTYETFTDWIQFVSLDKPHDKKDIQRVLNMFENNYPIQALRDIDEQQFVETVWKRIHDKRNAKNFNKLRQSLYSAVKSCVENNHVVCMSGRNARIFSCLTLLDFDKSIGQVKTKQVIRNEILQRCSSLVKRMDDHHIDKKHALSEMDSIAKEYTNLLPDEQLTTLLTECKSVIE